VKVTLIDGNLIVKATETGSDGFVRKQEGYEAPCLERDLSLSQVSSTEEAVLPSSRARSRCRRRDTRRERFECLIHFSCH